MTLSEKVKLMAYALIFALSFATIDAWSGHHPDSRIPKQMAMQSLSDMPEFSRLCTAPYQLLDMETGEWESPIVSCVIIDTPKFEVVCDAGGPEIDYINCPRVIGL